ncbi:MAG: hypothetical protein JNK16_12280 [Phycisphaerales bacterium]|nr:hypothetical protein [Phycisphaerales bacterium]
MYKYLVLAAAALTPCLTSANAEVVTINFENLAPGTALTSQYAPLGVRFATTPVADSGGVLRTSVEVLDFVQGGFRSNALWLAGNAITLTFDSDISDFSVVMRDTDRGSLLGRVRAFDALGNAMGHMTDMTGAFNTSWFYENTLRVATGGIRYIELTGDADGAIVDNITFTRVPAPGALALLPLGMLGLARRKRD